MGTISMAKWQGGRVTLAQAGSSVCIGKQGGVGIPGMLNKVCVLSRVPCSIDLYWLLLFLSMPPHLGLTPASKPVMGTLFPVLC